MCRKRLDREQDLGMSLFFSFLFFLSFLVWRVPGAFYSPGVNFKVAALVGPPPPLKGHGLG